MAVDVHVRDEAAVDLDGIDGQAVEHAQRGESRSEVVEVDAHAESAKILEDPRGVLDVVDEHRLSHLERKLVAGDSVAVEDVGDRRHEARVEHLAVRHIHADRQLSARRRHRHPLLQLPAGLAEHPHAEIRDDRLLFRDRNEQARADGAQLGVHPARERLEALDGAVVEREDRLVVQRDLALGHGLAKLLRQAPARQNLLADRLVELADEAASVLLRVVERGVRIAQHIVRGAVLGRSEHEAHAHLRADRLTADRDRLVERGHDARGDLPHIGRGVHAVEQEHELVAAKPRGKVAVAAGDVDQAHHLRQDAAHLDQQRVAGVVAKRVVDLLEAVEIEEHHGVAAARVALEAVDAGRDLVVQQHAVRKRGERIEEQLAFGALSRIDLVTEALVQGLERERRGAGGRLARALLHERANDLPHFGRVEGLA